MPGVTDFDAKADLSLYLQRAREALLWKLDGLSEYDRRRPLTPTGSNLLGIVKHVASVELEYFTTVFGRPAPGVELPWLSEAAQPNDDMWATPDQSTDEIVALYRRSSELADQTISELPLDAPGRVPWWSGTGEVTLHRILVHMIAEIQRHAGHADIVRELIDGEAGISQAYSNLPDGDAAWWQAYRDRVEEAARAAGTS
jgi:uncharacterized damage-inducible protein DinB